MRQGPPQCIISVHRPILNGRTRRLIAARIAVIELAFAVSPRSRVVIGARDVGIDRRAGVIHRQVAVEGVVGIADADAAGIGLLRKVALVNCFYDAVIN